VKTTVYVHVGRFIDKTFHIVERITASAPYCWCPLGRRASLVKNYCFRTMRFSALLLGLVNQWKYLAQRFLKYCLNNPNGYWD